HLRGWGARGAVGGLGGDHERVAPVLHGLVDVGNGRVVPGGGRVVDQHRLRDAAVDRHVAVVGAGDGTPLLHRLPGPARALVLDVGPVEDGDGGLPDPAAPVRHRDLARI